jgi:hypothetical protein
MNVTASRLSKIIVITNHPYNTTVRHEILGTEDKIPAGFESTGVGVVAEDVPISGAIPTSPNKVVIGTFSVLLDESMASAAKIPRLKCLTTTLMNGTAMAAIMAKRST